MFNISLLKNFVAVAIIFATVGAFWLQDKELKTAKIKAKNLQVELQQCKSENEAKRFELKWSEEFSNSLNLNTEAGYEETNKTNSNTTFYDSF